MCCNRFHLDFMQFDAIIKIIMNVNLNSFDNL